MRTNVSPPNQFALGVVLSYGYTIYDSGNDTIGGPFTVADTLTTDACPATASPAPGGAPIVCKGTYTLTGGDIALGRTTNTASASGTLIQSPPDSVTYPVELSPALTISKTATQGVSFDSAGDRVTYTYTVQNLGNSDFVTEIFVRDDKIGTPHGTPFSCLLPTQTNPFSFGEIATCTAIYTVTQVNMDAGEVTTNAVALTTFAPSTPNEIPVESPVASETAIATTNLGMTVTKSVIAGPAPAADGGVLSFEIRTENTGDQTLRGVSVTDPRFPALICADAVLTVGEVLICSRDYTITQADLDGQSRTGAVMTNTASVCGTDPRGQNVPASDTNAYPLSTPVPAVEAIKAHDPDPGTVPAMTGPGEVLHFVVTVRNTGNVTLSSSSVTDTLDPTRICTVGPLAPGAVDQTCVFTYTTVQADVDRDMGTNGGVINTVDVSAQPATPGAPAATDTFDLLVLGPMQEPAFTRAKAADQTGFAAVGDVLTYRYTVTNSGNVTLTAQPTVTGSRIDPVTCAAINLGLLPDATLECTGSDTVTQADLDAGSVVNLASVTSGKVPVGGPTASTTETVLAVRNPLMEMTKSPSITADAQVGDIITYSYAVRNVGNVTLSDDTPADAHTSAAGNVALPIAGDMLSEDAAPAGDSADGAGAGNWGVLAPGDTATFNVTYTVTQGDVDAGAPLPMRQLSRQPAPAAGQYRPPPTVHLRLWQLLFRRWKFKSARLHPGCRRRPSQGNAGLYDHG